MRIKQCIRIISIGTVAVSVAALTVTQASAKPPAPHTKAPACTDTWTARKSGNWANAKDWSTKKVPGPNTRACITRAGAKDYTVTITPQTGTASVRSLIVGTSGGKHTEALALVADNGDVSLDLAKASTVNKHGALLMNSKGNGNVWLNGPGALTNRGRFTAAAGKGWSRYLQTRIVNAGTFIAAANTVYDNSPFVNNGTLDVVKHGVYDFQANATFTQHGRINNKGTAEFFGNGVTLSGTGGNATGSALLVSAKKFADHAGTGSYDVVGNTTLAGTIPKGQTLSVVGNGQTDIRLALSGTVTNRGHLGLTSTTYNHGTGGNAWLDGTGRLTNYGIVSTAKGTGWSRYLEVPLINEKGATVALANAGTGGAAYVNGFAVANSGTISIAKGTTYDVESGSFAAKAGTIKNSGILKFNGTTITKTGGSASGTAAQLYGNATLKDSGGTGNFTFQQDGTLTGTIPTGQTITVDGNGSADVHLTTPANITNHGTLVFTSTTFAGQPAGGNSWLLGGKLLTNEGTIKTLAGDGWSRYLQDDIDNTTSGTIDLGGVTTYLGTPQGKNNTPPGTTITNNGHLTVAPQGQLKLAGDTDGQDNFVQTSTGTLTVDTWNGGGAFPNGNTSTTAPIWLVDCSAGACQHQYVSLGGTLVVQNSSTYTPTKYAVAYADDPNSIDGNFTTVTGGYYTEPYDSSITAFQGTNPCSGKVLC